MRILFFILAIVALYYIARHFWQKPSPPTKSQQKIDIVKCHKCGVHLPKHDAIKHGEQWYCPEHND